jgi:hypothetical protein
MAKEKETATENAEPVTPAVAPTVLTFDQRLSLARTGLALTDITAYQTLGYAYEQVLEIGTAMQAAKTASQGGGAAEVAQAMAKAQIEAADFLADRDRKERRGPNVSAFNPRGEREHPRPDIQGDIFWLGTKLHKEELTEAEITLLNRLTPGLYHGGQWKVEDKAPGTGARHLLVWFPNEETDDRANLPPTMIAMLEEMVGATATPVLA